MAKVAVLYLFFFFYSHFPICIKSLEFDPNDYELYGPTLAANNQLIIALKNRTGISFSAVSGYSTSSPIYCTVTYTSPNDTELYATMLAVGRNGVISSNINKFAFIAYSSSNSTTYLIVASIIFSTCQLTINYNATIISNPYPNYSVLGVNDNGTMIFYISDQNIYIYQSPSSFLVMDWSSVGLPSYNYLVVPAGIDLSQTWGIVGVYMRYNNVYNSFRATAYLINFSNCYTSFNVTCFQLLSQRQISYAATWDSTYAPQPYFTSYDYNPMYIISISINYLGYALFGVQSVNTVYLLSATSSSLAIVNYRFPSTIPSMGFGKAVGWLDNTTASILINNFTLGYYQWCSSTIELYPITSSSSLSNSISAYVSYPNSHQQLWSQLNPRLIYMRAVPEPSSLIYMDYVGNVHVILPSPSAYFAYTGGGIPQVNNTIYLAPTLQCPSGTIKNVTAYGKDLFRYCLLCGEGTFYSANQSNTSNQCTPCDVTTQFCPWGAVAALPISVLDSVSQAQVYPQSPENDVLEDILLINIFNIDFATDCLFKQPIFYASIIIGAGCLILLFMGILKLTGKLKKQRRMIKNLFKQTDLIGEGELWIGGVVSLAIVVILVFAYKFSSGFLNQYPIEKVGNATFACDSTLRNAKFSTSMQSIAIPLLEEEQPLFDMLDDQPFTLNVAFINTDFTAQNLQVLQSVGSYLINLNRTTIVSNGLLMISTDLTSHTTTISFNVTSNSAVGGIRVGLTGPSMTNKNYFVQELNFSSVFNYTNRTLTQDPMVTIQLIKLVNETEPLSDNDLTQYSALWIPTFIINEDQLFYTESDFELHHVLGNTILTVEITEATYYILNQQEPISKLTELIFTNILFTTMCIELFALVFLFFKLAFLPIFRALRGLCTGPKQVTPIRGNNCPYCGSVDAETLPAYRIPFQRSVGDTPMYPIRRQTSDIANLHSLSTTPIIFN